MRQNPFSFMPGLLNSHLLTNNDLRLLMDELGKPCLLLKSSKHVVICVNFLFSELTGLGGEELTNQKVEMVFPNYPEEALQDGVPYQWNMVRKNKSNLKAEVTPRYISKDGDLLLLIFNNRPAASEYEYPLATDLASEIGTLLIDIPTSSWKSTLLRLDDICRKVFVCTHTAFYFQEEKDADLVNFLNNNGKFPEQLPVIELKRFNMIDFWQPGKRVLSEIQRTGRLNNFQRIVTLPVRSRDFRKGLFVMAFAEENQAGGFEKVVAAFAGIFSGILDIQRFFDDASQLGIKGESDHEQFARFFDHASDCALILNSSHQILDFNQKTIEMLKYSAYELMNRDACEIFQNSSVCEDLSTIIIDEPFTRNEPVDVFDREGTRIPVTLMLIPLRPEVSGRRLLILQDASYRVDAEVRIRQYESKAALGDVVADFAHEVRNPINNISTGLQLLKKRIGDEDTVGEAIERMQEDCLRLNDLMESVLSFSRQKMDHFKEVNLELLLQRVLSRMQTKFQQHNISALFKSECENTNLLADQRSLEQAFINLITNAFDAIKQEGGIISVKLEPGETGWICTTISDTGPGIPPEIQAKMFEPFVTDKPKGTGLGLAITKRMVEAHHGKILMETYPGGTIFKILLPRI